MKRSKGTNGLNAYFKRKKKNEEKVHLSEEDDILERALYSDM